MFIRAGAVESRANRRSGTRCAPSQGPSWPTYLSVGGAPSHQQVFCCCRWIKEHPWLQDVVGCTIHSPTQLTLYTNNKGLGLKKWRRPFEKKSCSSFPVRWSCVYATMPATSTFVTAQWKRRQKSQQIADNWTISNLIRQVSCVCVLASLHYVDFKSLNTLFFTV